jgi:hypothetical protein
VVHEGAETSDEILAMPHLPKVHPKRDTLSREVTVKQGIARTPLALIVFAMSCNPAPPAEAPPQVMAVRGQVWVTRAEGSSVKLGGIEVRAYSANDAIGAVERAKAEYARKREEALRKLHAETEKAAEEAIVRDQRDAARLRSELVGLSSEIEKLEAALKVLEDENFPSQYSAATLPGRTITVGDRVEGHLANRLGTPHQTARTDTGEIRERWILSDLVFTAEGGKIVSITETTSKRIAPLAATLGELRSKQQQARSALERATSTGKATKQVELPDLGASAASIFEELPEPLAFTVTNADGEFTLDVLASDRFVIAAHATRQLFFLSEEFYWMVWVKDARLPIYLTNRNEMTVEARENVYLAKVAQ